MAGLRNPEAPARDLAHGHPHWDGTPGRDEVWYLTLTDSATGTGVWIHHETSVPASGADAYAHGWISVFPVDGPPSTVRWGPAPLERGRRDQSDDGAWQAGGGAAIEAAPSGCRSVGDIDGASWDVTLVDAASPIYTYGRTAWTDHLLPGCQYVPFPTAAVSGTVRVGDVAVDLGGLESPGGIGGLARIYAHGSAQRWGWLHADLGDGDVLEIVTATARRPGLRRVPPLAAVQLRVGGEDWPSNPLTALPRFRTRLDTARWAVRGSADGHRLLVEVIQPAERCVVLGYVDPDGATATCTNTERADAVITWQRRQQRAWVTEREWRLDAMAHAEVGTRP